MKTSIKQISFLCVFFFAPALIISCGVKRTHPEYPGGDSQSVVAETPPKKRRQKPSQQLTRQKERQAFAELDEKTSDTQAPKPKTPGSDFQDKTAPKESERTSVTSPVQSDFTTTLQPLTDEQKAEGWVEVIGECYQGLNMTTEEAQRKALKDAERKAIGQSVIQAQTFQIRSETQHDFHESFTQLSQSTTYGKIINRKEFWAPVEDAQSRPGGPPVPLYRVTLRAKVAEEKGKSDPSFQVDLQLNDGKVTFREGDEMILHITPTKDCYITVFNVLSDGAVLVLFPPQGHTQQVVAGGKKFSIPSEAERRQGIRFRVGLLPGKTKDTEYVWVVATKEDIPFLPRETKVFQPDITILSGKVVLPTYKSALEEINRWLVSIPLDKRAFDMAQYEIRKK